MKYFKTIEIVINLYFSKLLFKIRHSSAFLLQAHDGLYLIKK